jgi:KDO2-lipid IV(A) lauroyltransferase
MLLLIRILSRLPLPLLYFVADALVYPLMYHVVRYRRAVVAKNLRMSFPEQSAKQRRDLERQFYRRFASTIMEIIYGYRISDEEMRERFVFENVELVEELAHKNKGVFFMLGHLGNWEWIADIGKRYTDTSIKEYNVYRQQKSPSADKAMLALRLKRGGGGCIEKKQLLRQLVAMRHADNPITIGLISDQKPSPRNAHVWTTFLNQETAFLDGGEVLARKFGYAVTYVHVESPKRGYYRARFEVITDNPAATNPTEITLAYARLLEQNILESPALWLWTHNRWKWSRITKEG